jgi:hypothetical protein
MNEPEWIFPFNGMELGDSFFIPTLRAAPLIYTAIEESKKAKIRVKAHPAVKDGVMGIRIWRVD